MIEHEFCLIGELVAVSRVLREPTLRDVFHAVWSQVSNLINSLTQLAPFVS